jgi:hypothetical protein
MGVTLDWSFFVSLQDKWQVHQLFTQTYTNQTTSCLVCSWSTFGARMNHRQIRTHKTQPGPDLGEGTAFPFIVFFVLGHGACTQMSFCFRILNLGVLKFSKLGLPQLWRPITSFLDLRLRRGLKQSYSPYLELCNGMWHATYT